MNATQIKQERERARRWHKEYHNNDLTPASTVFVKYQPRNGQIIASTKNRCVILSEQEFLDHVDSDCECSNRVHRMNIEKGYSMTIVTYEHVFCEWENAAVPSRKAA